MLNRFLVAFSHCVCLLTLSIDQHNKGVFNMYIYGQMRRDVADVPAFLFDLKLTFRTHNCDGTELFNKVPEGVHEGDKYVV